MRDVGSPGRRGLASIAALLGPMAALLHEADIGTIGPSGTLWPIAAISFLAAAGMATVMRAPRVATAARWLLAMPNLGVLLLYGFLLVYFGLGGSR